MQTHVKEIFEILFERYPALNPMRDAIAEAFELWRESYAAGGKTLVCGNGGSSADADHIVGELMKGFLLGRAVEPAFVTRMEALYGEEGVMVTQAMQCGLPAISLSAHAALVTAFSNDVQPEGVFAQQVYGYGKAGDVLLGLSTSGHSQNVLKAMMVAKALGMTTIGLTGRDGGAMKAVCDVTLIAPAEETYQIQEYHLPIYHTLCAMLEAEFFGKPA